MKVAIRDFNNTELGSIDLCDNVFGLKPRVDILTRVVQWQMAKRRSGNHQTKGVSDISGTTRKPYRQKGTGRARQGSLRSPQFRGGAVIFGPLTRDHAFALPKKVRALGLKMALSEKLISKKLIVLDHLLLDAFKTKTLLSKLNGLGVDSALIVAGDQVEPAFLNASSNLPFVDVLPQQGLNVLDILRKEFLILHKDALAYLERRFK